jgi:hypothetical protein
MPLDLRSILSALRRVSTRRSPFLSLGTCGALTRSLGHGRSDFGKRGAGASDKCSVNEETEGARKLRNLGRPRPRAEEKHGTTTARYHTENEARNLISLSDFHIRFQAYALCLSLPRRMTAARLFPCLFSFLSARVRNGLPISRLS